MRMSWLRPDWIAKLHDDEFVVITPAGREYRSRPPTRAMAGLLCAAAEFR